MSSLPSLRLDDIAARDLHEPLRERIPAESGGLWTLHAPVDPGITLLELFAYLLDQRLYWLDQVPDALLRGIFRLLGEAPHGSRPAATVMRLEHDPPNRVCHVPRALRLALVGGTDDVVFTTETDVVLLPVPRVSIEVEGVDCTEDLKRMRGVDLLPADGSAGEARLVLHVDGPLGPPPRRGRAGLLFRLDSPSKVKPQWLAEEEEGPVAAPARLEWRYRATGAPAPVALPADAVEDGTGGLRRSGIVRIALPPDWEPDGPPGADGLTPFSLFLRTPSGTFTSPPRLVELVPNAVVACHLVRVRAPRKELEKQVAKWLPLPGRTLDLGAPSLLLEDPTTIRVRLRERGGRWRTWSATPELAFHGPADRVFVVDRAAGVLRFGDGLTGRIPVPGAPGPSRATAVYHVGGGTPGNVGLTKWEVPGRTTLRGWNVVQAEGGSEPESLVEARSRVEQSLRRRERAVTRTDYEVLAESTPGIAISRARAAVGFDPRHPCDPVPGVVSVFVVPYAPRDDGPANGPLFVAAPEPDPGALEAVARRLERARLIGSEIVVLPPRYRHVRVAVTVSSQPGDTDRLRSTLDDELRDFLDPLVGGEEREGWPFGEPLRPSALMRRAQVAVGSDATVSAVAVGLDGDAPHEDCRDLAVGPHDLLVLDEVAVRWEAGADGETGLR